MLSSLFNAMSLRMPGDCAAPAARSPDTAVDAVGTGQGEWTGPAQGITRLLAARSALQGAVTPLPAPSTTIDGLPGAAAATDAPPVASAACTVLPQMAPAILRELAAAASLVTARTTARGDTPDSAAMPPAPTMLAASPATAPAGSAPRAISASLPAAALDATTAPSLAATEALADAASGGSAGNAGASTTDAGSDTGAALAGVLASLSTAAGSPTPDGLAATSGPAPGMVLGHAASPAQRADGALPPISVPLDSPQWGNELASRVLTMTHEKWSEAAISVTPDELGPIEIKLRFEGDRVHLQFGATSAEAREALSSNMHRLREMLAGDGLSLGQALVGQHGAGSDRRAPAGTPNIPFAAGAAEAEPVDLPAARLRPSEARSGLLDEFA
jgi:flagellar hook-length control protein FliK